MTTRILGVWVRSSQAECYGPPKQNHRDTTHFSLCRTEDDHSQWDLSLHLN